MVNILGLRLDGGGVWLGVGWKQSHFIVAALPKKNYNLKHVISVLLIP